MSLKSALYTLLKWSNDYNAIKRGKVGTGWLARRIFG
jgi:hypothetical protein